MPGRGTTLSFNDPLWYEHPDWESARRRCSTSKAWRPSPSDSASWVWLEGK
jgi:hypothetical protein